MKTVRAVLYARKSKDSQGPTNEHQLHLLREHAQRRGWSILAEIEDDTTGKSMKRPGLQQVRELLQRHRGAVLVATRLDRLARNTRGALDLVQELGELGCGLVFIAQEIDTTTAAGRLVFTIFAALAQCEAEQVSERTMLGMQAARERGAAIGRPRVTLSADQVRDAMVRGGSFTKAAALVKVSKSTFRRRYHELFPDSSP